MPEGLPTDISTTPPPGLSAAEERGYRDHVRHHNGVHGWAKTAEVRLDELVAGVDGLEGKVDVDGTVSEALDAEAAARDEAIDNATKVAVAEARISAGNRAIGLGDSIILGASDNEQNRRRGQSWFHRLTDASGQQVRFFRNAGVGGDNTQEMLDRLDEDVIAYRPDVCLVLGGTNDLAAMGWTPATSVDNLAAIYFRLREAGIVPVALTVPPRDESAGSEAVQDAIEAHRDLLIGHCFDYGIRLADIYTVLVDPATRDYKDGYSGDGVHPNDLGAQVAAETVADALADGLRDPIDPVAVLAERQADLDLPISPLWVPPLATVNDSPRNLLLNGLFLDRPSGDPPRLAHWSDTDPRPTFEPVEGGAGDWAIFDGSSGTIVTRQNIGSGFEVGDVVSFACRYQLEAVTGGDFTLQMEFRDGSNSAFVWVQPVRQWKSPTGRNVALAVAKVPPGTASIDVRLVSAGAGGMWRVAQATVTNLSAL